MKPRELILQGLAPRFRGPICAMGSQVLASGTNFLMTVLVVRDVGLEQFGLFSLCFLMLTVSRSFLNSTVLLPASAISPKLLKSSLLHYRGFLLMNLAGFIAISSLVLVGWLYATAATITSIDPAILAPPLVVCNCALCIGDFFRRVYFINEAHMRALTIDVVRYSLQAALVTASFCISPESLVPERALFLMAAASLLACTLGTAWYGKCSWSTRFALHIWPRHRNFIFFMLPSAALEALQGPGVFFIVGPFIGEALVGAVRAIQNIANTLNLPFNALQQIAPSMAARASRVGGPAAFTKLLKRIFIFAVILTVSISGFVFVFSTYILEDFLKMESNIVNYVLFLFCLSNIISAGRLPLSVRAQVTERPNELFIASVASAAVAITVAYFVNAIGMIAIPAAKVAGEVFYAAVLLVFVALGHRRQKK